MKRASAEEQEVEWWKDKANNMVISQIERRNIHDPLVLKVMRDIPRHSFIPAELKDVSYSDRPLPIGKRQTIFQPYIVALMTELLQLKGNEKVLEIGTGSGYQAAVLSSLAEKTLSVEVVKSLADSARNKLKIHGYKNVAVKWGDGYQGWIDHAPYDRVIVTAVPDQIPQALIDQLKIGGYIVIPVGSYYQELKVIKKVSEKEITEESIIPVRFVPMVHPESPVLDK